MISAFTPRATIGFFRALSAALVIAAVPAPATAQQTDPTAGSSGTLGPVGVTPRVSWQTEYDDNTLRTSVPVSDVISTISAGTDVRGRIRRVGMSATAGADWVHYSKLVSERGANGDGSLRLDFLLNRVAPYVSGSYRNSRQRLNPEIDSRPRIENTTLAMGALVHVGGKSSFDVSANRSQSSYARDAEEDGVRLGDVLSYGSDQITLKFLQDVTPLTRINVTGEVFKDQFDVASRRNSDNVRLSTGFESTGQLNGQARVGLRILKPQDRSLPESRGLFVSVATSATIFDRLQIGIDADRDLVPSYRVDVAYYESYGYGATVSYAMRPSLRLSAMVGRRFGDYRTADGYQASFANQAGMGPDEIRLGHQLSVGRCHVARLLRRLYGKNIGPGIARIHRREPQSRG